MARRASIRTTPGAVITLASLGFNAVWLLGWTCGVAFIQAILLSGEVPFLAIFLVTHGGAELFVLREMAAKVRSTAELPAVQPELELDHDGLRARWPNGNGSVLLAFAAAALGVVLHAGLFGSLAVGLRDGLGLTEIVLLPVLAAVWSYTAYLFGRAVLAHLRQRGEVVLQADLDAVTVELEGSFVEQRTVLPLHGLWVDDAQLADGLLVLGSDDAEVGLRIAEGPQSRELVELLRTMTGRSTRAETPEAPEALRALREA